MSVDQNQTVDAEAQADTVATPVDATVQAETPAAETPVVVEPPVAPKKRATAAKAVKAAETPAPAAVVETPALIPEETPVAETPAPAAAVETPALVPEETPVAETPAPAAVVETPALVPEETPVVETPAPAAVQPQTDPVKPLSNGLVWGSKRKEKQARELADQSCEVEVTNNGAHSFEAYTRTPLPSNQTVVITCESPRQRAAVINKLNKLNQLAGVARYITLIK
jgi:hypothetical protein